MCFQNCIVYQNINLLYVYIYLYLYKYIYIIYIHPRIVEHILIKPYIFNIAVSFVLFLNKGQVHKKMNQAKVSITAKNNFSMQKVLSRTPNSYGDTDDMPFCNNFKFSMFYFTLEILYLSACRNYHKNYYRTKQIIEIYAFYPMKYHLYQQTVTRKSIYFMHLNRFLRSFHFQ